VSWRARIGGFNRGVHVHQQMKSNGLYQILLRILSALTLSILLLMSGIESNPGPGMGKISVSKLLLDN